MPKSVSQLRQELYAPYKTEDLINSYKEAKIGLERSLENNSGGIVAYEKVIRDLESELGERGVKL